ncbi:hypothetical protein [Bradyrhizobium sp. WYCCWR 12699]|uniref:hypothetical protein n=1 Tax=Bradyrhizobium sp. WYCCWR 12699 TaxID=3064203 RepID=UPI0028A40ECF|nr:hypothetical protein [Bradyrhizobium sp. WYCCWR 12699]MDT4740694.1 hypothetical protein [Bradyrhizobium sp. WYCCWR 12699]
MNARFETSQRPSLKPGWSGNKGRAALLILAILLMACLAKIVLPMIDQAKPSLVDDHDIVFALDGGSTVSLRSIGTWLAQTPEYRELLESGKTTRFRPGYYVLKAIEIYAWGDNMRLWYLFRYVADIGTTMLIAALFLRTFGLPSAVAFILLYMGHQSWSDLIPRLGPTEFQGNCAAALVVWSAWKYATDDNSGKYVLWLLAMASFLFSILKEVNSLYLLEASVLAISCGLFLQAPRLVRLGLLSGLIACAVFAFLLMTVRETSSALTLKGAISDFRMHLRGDQVFRIIGLVTAVLMVILLAIDFIRKGQADRRHYALLLLVLALEPTRLATYFLTHPIAGVDGFDALSMRYAFPFVLMQALAIALVVGVLSERLAILSIPKIWANASIGAMLSSAIVLAVLVSNQGILHPMVKQSVDLWRQFNSDADQAIKDVGHKLVERRLAGGNPALFVSGPTPGIWEPALALALYLKLRLSGTPVYADITGVSDIEHDYAVYLLTRYGAWPISGEETQKLKANCIEVHVDIRRIANSKCDIIQIIKPL